MKHAFFLLFTLISTFSFSQTIFWGPEIEVATSTEGRNNPRIVLNGDDMPVVLWGDNNENLRAAVWNGTSFNAPSIINGANPALSGSNFGPDIASYGDTIYAIYKEDPPTSGNIFVVRSTDGGATFDAPVQVDNIGTNLSEFVHIGVDQNGHPIAVFNEFNAGWTNPRWSMARSDDWGATFNPDTLVSGWSGGGNTPACECCPAAIDASGNTVVIAYRDNNSNVRDTWAAVSTDNATSFTAGMNVDFLGWAIMSCPTTGPDVQIVGDTLYSTFMSSASGQGHVYYSKSEISSMSGGNATEITSQFAGLTKQNYPRLSIVGNAGVIFWQQTSGGRQQMAISYSDDITTGWTASFDTIAENYATIGDVAMSSSSIYVVWSDYASNTVKFRKGSFTGAGIAENSSSDLVAVYPNPASEHWTLGLSASNKQRTIQIFDVRGQLVKEVVVPSGAEKMVVEIADLEAGVYSCVIDENSQSIKLIKK